MNGFTEAEKAAMMWRKQQREQDNKNQESNPNISRPRRDTAGVSFPQRCHSDRRSRRSNSRNQRYSRNDRPNEWDKQDSSYFDDFGREISREKYLALEREKRKDNDSRDNDRRRNEIRRRSTSGDRDRSEDRSRSRRSRSRNRSYEDDRKRRRSREERWSHDLYHDLERASPDRDGVRRPDENYRPPSPTWISRAGGVAIMKKRTVSDNSRPS